MNMSVEDLRENYKNSKMNGNGATFRRNLLHKTDIHLIKIRNQASSSGVYQSLEDLNKKYNLKKNNEHYSLNKSKRWELSNLLSANMCKYKEENLDVRLYETVLFRNKRYQSNNLIKIEQSKGEKINIKHKYANLKSIKQKERLDQQQDLLNTAKPVVKKVNRFKMNSQSMQKNKNDQLKKIIIYDKTDDYNSDNDDENIHYEIEYAPKSEFAKDGQNGKNDKFDKISRKLECKIFNRYISYSDDEALKRSINFESEEDDDGIDHQSYLNSNIEINLNDLIENVSKVIINNHNSKPKSNLIETNSKDNQKIYINNPYSRKTNKNTPPIYNYCEPLQLSIELNKKSIQADLIKQIYGNKYNEAKECSPRRFNLNISGDVITALELSSNNRNKLDLVVWLRFQETLELDDTSFFNVSICSNLIKRESISMENINACLIHDLDFVVLKSIEMFKSLPTEQFKFIIENKSNPIKNGNHIGRLGLPNICSQNEIKDLKDIKLEFINDFKEVSNVEIINLNKTKFECILCFDADLTQTDCTILNKCGHVVCNECMKYYVDSRLANSLANSGKFPCPGCNNNELELALMINFASNANQLEIYLQLTVEKIWFVLKNYKWCPASNCSRVLKIDLLAGFGILSCVCGYKTCLKCNNPPHFPAACKQIPNYYKELEKTFQTSKVEDNGYYISNGKKCPECYTFMEKNFGCNQMHCSVCSTAFCWNCLKKWEEHLKLNDGMHSCKEKEDKDYISVEFFSKIKKKSDKKSYEDSLFHRKTRLSISVRNYSLLSERLIKTIDFDGSPVENAKANNLKRQEIRLFLKELVSFLNELHFVCEHGYVCLRDKSLSTESRNKISYVIKQIEAIIWRINYTLEFGSGLNAFKQIQMLYDQGIGSIKMLNEIKVKC